jgi:hypothetical protein
MMRGYAIGLGAGTQAMLFLFGELIFGKPDVLARALLTRGVEAEPPGCGVAHPRGPVVTDPPQPRPPSAPSSMIRGD